MRPLLAPERNAADVEGGMDVGPGWTRQARVAIGATILVAAIQTVSLGPLAWDGGYFFAKIVERAGPYTPHGRIGAVIPQAPAWLAVRLDAPYALVRIVYAAGYAAMAPLGLWLSWRTARAAGRPDLVAWPILTTCAVLVPAAWFSVSEAVIVAGFVWVPWIAAAAGLPRGTRVLGAVTLAAVLSLHPLGAGVAIVAALLVVARRPSGTVLALAGGVVVIALLRVLIISGDADESSALNAARIVRTIGGSLEGPQLLGLAAVGAIALAMWLGAEVKHPRLVLTAGAVAIASYVAFAAVPSFWNGVHGIRYAAVLLPVPLTVALWHEIRHRPGPDRQVVRQAVLKVLVGGYVATLGVLGASWWRVTDRLDDELASLPAGCVERTDLTVDRDTLNHWTTTVLALTRQGLEPRVIVANPAAGGCAAWKRTGEIPLEPTVDPLRADGPWHTGPDR